MNTEIVFEVVESPEGGYEAYALGHSIFTEGHDLDHLWFMVRDAARSHFDEPDPPAIRLHFLDGKNRAPSGA